MWEIFRKYHYLNTDLHQGAEQYVAIWQGRLVAHTGVIQMPMKKGQKRIHRFVVLPDYQGIGIGTAFITEVARIVSNKGYEVNLTTTTPSLVPALVKHPNWILARYGRSQGKMQFDVYGKQYSHLRSAISNNRITYSFWYKDNGKRTKLKTK